MDKRINYGGVFPSTTDLTQPQRFAQVALANAVADILFNTSDPENISYATRFAGFKPTFPGGMVITLGAGRIYTIADVDTTGYGPLAADTRQILQQGQNDIQSLTFGAPPATGGHSRIDIIQMKLTVTDTDLVTLPYYDSDNPTVAWSGPADAGTAQATTRQTGMTVSVKAGASGASPSAPTPDAGYTAVFNVTVTNGDTNLAAGNIAPASNTLFFPGLEAQSDSSLSRTLVHASKTNTQNVTAASWTKLTFNTEVYDSLGEFASSTFTAGVTGIYELNVTVSEDITVDSGMKVRVRKNGSTTVFEVAGENGGSGSAGVSVVLASPPFALNATDTLEVEVYLGGSGIATFGAAYGATGNWFSVKRLP